MRWRTALAVAVGTLARVLLFASLSLENDPLVNGGYLGFHRLGETVFAWDHGVNVTGNGTEPIAPRIVPLILRFFLYSRARMLLFLFCCDAVVCYALVRVATRHKMKTEMALNLYCLNPLSAAAAASLSLSPLILALSLGSIAVAHDRAVLSAILLALATIIDPYNILLFVVLFMLSQNRIRLTFCFTAATAVLLSTSCLFMDPWAMLQHTYLPILTIQDSNPTVGLYWYLVISCPLEYRVLFLTMLQSQLLLFTALTTSSQLRHNTSALLHTLSFIAFVYKPFPSIGDMGFLLTSALLLWPQLPHVRIQGFISLFVFSVTLCTSTLFWARYAYYTQGNINFFFMQQTICFASFIVFNVELLGASKLNVKVKED